MKLLKIFIGLILSVGLISNAEAAWPYTVTYSPSTSDTILATHVTTSNSEHVNNNIPESIDDLSNTVAEMRSTSDPYAGSTEVQATTLAIELQQLRFMFAQITGQTNWYQDANVLFLDGANSKVGIGTITPDTDLEIVSESLAQGIITNYSADAVGGHWALRKARGTEASPTATNADDNLGTLSFRGYGTSLTSTKASVGAYADELWDATSNGTRLTFHTTDNTTTTLDERMRIDHNGNVGIGNTNPGEMLSVEGNIELAHATNASIFRDIATNLLTVAGGSSASNGAHIALYGGSHATEANNAYHDATDHYFRSQSGSTAQTQVRIDTAAGSYHPALQVTKNAEIVALFDRLVNDGIIIELAQATSTEGTISVSGTTVSYNAFCGSHYTQLKEGQTELPVGAVVVSTGEIIPCKKEQKEYFSYINTTDIAGSKRVYGTWFGRMSDDSKGMSFGKDGKPVYLIAQVGLFKIRVTDTNGNIENGDYLETSMRPMEARRQTSGAKLNSTIGKAMVDVNWDTVAVDSELGYKWKLIPITF